MSTQGERLEELLNKKRLSQEAFGDSIGVSKSSVNKVVTGKGNFELKKYITINEVYNISLDWLILGEGSMLIKENAINEDDVVNDFNASVSRMDRLERTVAQLQKDIQSITPDKP